MRRHILFAICFGMIGSLSLPAQDDRPSEDAKATSNPVVDLPSDVNVTPEMWMYLHEYKRQLDPKEAVRRKAEFRSAQRRKRIEAQKWFGQSKLRPTANSLPYYTNSYGSTWTGLPWTPDQWTAYKTTYRFYNDADPDYYYSPMWVAGPRRR